MSRIPPRLQPYYTEPVRFGVPTLGDIVAGVGLALIVGALIFFALAFTNGAGL